MSEKSLKVLENNTTFFNKISNRLTKLLIPTKVGFNSILINIKRNSVIKNYENYIELKAKNSDKLDASLKKYEESYTLYLEAIDKYIMDSVYKKVKNNSASQFEKDALSNYYNIVHLKDKDYNAYKAKKQEFLLSLDYESVLNSSKDKTIKSFKTLYIERIDDLYKSLLKNYSIKLADGIKGKVSNQDDLYNDIFSTLNDYVKNILPIKIENGYSEFDKIRRDYDELDRFDVGKLDKKDHLEKNMILVAMSRTLFTHSLPLVAAENCYKKLVADARNLIGSTDEITKKDDIYEALIKIIVNYNEKLLSTKVYWENQKERENYKKFWNEYSNANGQELKEIAILKKELVDLKGESGPKMKKVKQYYRKKLTELGISKFFKNMCKTMNNLQNNKNTKIRSKKRNA